MWADRKTDMTKLIVAFRNVANALMNAIPVPVNQHVLQEVRTVLSEAPCLTCRCI